MATAGDIVVKFGADISDFEQKIIKAEKDMNKLGARFEKIGNGMKSLFTVPILGAGAALTALAVKSGAVEKEQKKLEASMNALGASVADVVGPALDAVADVVGDVAAKFSAMDTETKKTIVTVGLAVAAIGPLALGFGKAVKLAAELTGVFRGLNVFLAANPWFLLATAVGAVGVAMATLANSTVAADKAQARSIERAQDLATAMIERAKAFGVETEEGKKYLAKAKEYNLQAQGMTETLVKQAGAQDNAADAARLYGEELKAQKKAAEDAAKAQQGFSDSIGAALVAQFAATQDELAITDEIARGWAEAADAVEDYETHLSRLQKARVEAKGGKVVETQSEESPLFDNVAQGVVSGIASADVPGLMAMGIDTMVPGLGAALSPILDAMVLGEEEARKTLDQMFESIGVQLENLLSNMDVLFKSLISALPQIFWSFIKGMFNLYADLLGMIWDVYSGLWIALWDGLKQAGRWLRDDLGDWIKKDVPDALKGFFTEWLPQAFKDAGQWIKQAVIDGWEWVKDGFAFVAESFVNFFVDVLNGMLRALEAIVPFDQDWGNIQHVSFRADGGPVTAGMPYIVGERGPEMFVPSQSGDIVPNGGGITINIQGGRDDAETIARKTVRAIRDARRLGLLDVPLLAGVGSA